MEIVNTYYDFYGYDVSITNSTLKTSGAYDGFYNYGSVSLTGCSKIDMADVEYCAYLWGDFIINNCADVSFSSSYDDYYGIYCTDVSITNSKVKTQGESYGGAIWESNVK